MQGLSIKICKYVPHGAVPDVCGFAPAIVAQNFAKFLREDTYIISALENYRSFQEEGEYGHIYRIIEAYDDIFVVAVSSEPKDAFREKTYFEREKLRKQLLNTNRFIDLPPVSHSKLALLFWNVQYCYFPTKK